MFFFFPGPCVPVTMFAETKKGRKRPRLLSGLQHYRTKRSTHRPEVHAYGNTSCQARHHRLTTDEPPAPRKRRRGGDETARRQARRLRRCGGVLEGSHHHHPRNDQNKTTSAMKHMAKPDSFR